MTAIEVCNFRISFTWFHDHEVDHFYLDTSDKCWGGLYTNLNRETWVSASSGLVDPDTAVSGLKRVRTLLNNGQGEVCISYRKDRWEGDIRIYQRGRLSNQCPVVPLKREPVDCQCLNAILDYLDNGEEVDLLAAIDMLTDAGKFE